MKKLLFAAIGALSLVTGAAHATTLDFSFSNTVGGVNGTVTGQVFGLNPNGTSAATDVVIDSYPAALVLLGSYPTPIDVFAWTGTTVVENSFTLSGGSFVSGGYAIDGPGGDVQQLILNYDGVGNFLTIGNADTQAVWDRTGNPFSAATAVPEPTSMALVGAGAFGLGLIRRKRIQ